MTIDECPDMIVTRHPGAIDWVAKALGGRVNESRSEVYLPIHLLDDYDDEGRAVMVPGTAVVPVHESVTADDVRGAHVVGNLPLHLATKCRRVQVIEFGGDPPRGAEYSAEGMQAAGARLVGYVVREG